MRVELGRHAEPATDVPPWATMSTSAAGRRAVPIIKRADRDFAPDCRIESGTAAPTAARRDLHVDEQPIDGCGADDQNTITVRLAKLQSTMLLERGSKDGIITWGRGPRARAGAARGAGGAS